MISYIIKICLGHAWTTNSYNLVRYDSHNRRYPNLSCKSLIKNLYYNSNTPSSVRSKVQNFIKLDIQTHTICCDTVINNHWYNPIQAICVFVLTLPHSNIKTQSCTATSQLSWHVLKLLAWRCVWSFCNSHTSILVLRGLDADSLRESFNLIRKFCTSKKKKRKKKCGKRTKNNVVVFSLILVTTFHNTRIKVKQKSNLS